jgi:tRNA threonylcarbamoyladenosine biosynthesis protein TsaE
MDLYRLSDPEELWELGWQDLGSAGELVLVEWPERAGPYLPADRWDINLSTPRISYGSARGTPGSTVRAVDVRCIGSPPPLPGFLVRVSEP